MSFKLKTILLFILTSLIPYLILISYIIYKTQEQIVNEVRENLNFDLELIIDRIDNKIEEIYKDFVFISKLDIMDDIISSDIDKRITNALLSKKKDINLMGDYFVTDLNGKIVASSNLLEMGKELNVTNTKFKIDVISSFNNKKIGEFYLNYEIDNLKQYLKTREGKVAFLYDFKLNKYFFKKDEIIEQISLSKKLKTLENFEVFVSINKDFALKEINAILLAIILAIVGGVALITLVSIYFASKIISPIKYLSDTAIKIADTKDYSQRVLISSSDEIGKLGVAFNKMVESVEDGLKKLQLESENQIKLSEEKAKSKMLENLSTKLSKYLSPQIYDSIFTGKQDVKLESKRKKLTIFFSDIVGFTETTDTMESEDLAELLNHYLNEMSLIGLESGATIDKFIGDAILAFFGDPESKGIKEDALLCVDMAIKMQKKVLELEKYWQNKGFSKPFKVRMGINTGYLTVGNFGSENRMDYTIIGGAVNLASRIESIATPNEIWISEETYLLIKDKIYCEKMEEISVKGIKHSIKVYKVIDYFENLKNNLIIDSDLNGLLIENSKIKIENKEVAINTLEKLLKELKLLE